MLMSKTEKFGRIEQDLYEEYPEFIEEKNNYFTTNGIKINRNKTLEENNIKNNDVILLAKYIIEDE